MARVMAFNVGLAGVVLTVVGVVKAAIDQWNSGGDLSANLDALTDGFVEALYWGLFVIPMVVAYQAVLFAARRLERRALRIVAVAASPMIMALVIWSAAETDDFEAWGYLAAALAPLPYGAVVRLPGDRIRRRAAVLVLAAPVLLCALLLAAAAMADAL